MKGGVSSQSVIVKRYFNARTISYLAVLIAIVCVLQIMGVTIKIGATQMSLVLVPIVLGGLILGPLAGGILGFIFGLIVLIQGICGADGFTFLVFSDHPYITTAVCLVKGTAAGLAAGWIYDLLKNKNKTLAAFLAAGAAPIVNTGLFILGALFMSDTLRANYVADGTTVIYFLVIACAGVNFILEFAVNLICAPAIRRVTEVVEKSIKKN